MQRPAWRGWRHHTQELLRLENSHFNKIKTVQCFPLVSSKQPPFFQCNKLFESDPMRLVCRWS